MPYNYGRAQSFGTNRPHLQEEKISQIRNKQAGRKVRVFSVYAITPSP
jgi:hypothetical protein